MEPIQGNPDVVVVLLYATLAAVSAAVGALPLSGGARVDPRHSAFAYALASGLMLGAGYILMSRGLEYTTMPVVVGAGLGVLYSYWTQTFSGTTELGEDDASQATDFSIKFILSNALHSVPEGVAIGIAMVVSIRLGIFLAVALAVHNLAEAMVLTDILRSGGTSRRQAAVISIVTNVPQVLLAVVVFAVVPAITGLHSWVLGFAAGAMVYLVMTELLPFSYERAGGTGIALVVSFATGAVVLLSGFFG